VEALENRTAGLVRKIVSSPLTPFPPVQKYGKLLQPGLTQFFFNGKISP
jgi:hypothetical protein